MIFSGKSPRAEIMNILELPEALHPYYVGTQAHPELISRPLSPSPLFLGLVHAALRQAYPDSTQPLVYPAESAAQQPSRASPVAAPSERHVEKV